MKGWTGWDLYPLVCFCFGTKLIFWDQWRKVKDSVISSHHIKSLTQILFLTQFLLCVKENQECHKLYTSRGHDLIMSCGENSIISHKASQLSHFSFHQRIILGALWKLAMLEKRDLTTGKLNIKPSDRESMYLHLIYMWILGHIFNIEQNIGEIKKGCPFHIEELFKSARTSWNTSVALWVRKIWIDDDNA